MQSFILPVSLFSGKSQLWGHHVECYCIRFELQHIWLIETQGWSEFIVGVQSDKKINISDPFALKPKQLMFLNYLEYHLGFYLQESCGLNLKKTL